MSPLKTTKTDTSFFNFFKKQPSIKKKKYTALKIGALVVLIQFFSVLSLFNNVAAFSNLLEDNMVQLNHLREVGQFNSIYSETEHILKQGNMFDTIEITDNIHGLVRSNKTFTYAEKEKLFSLIENHKYDNLDKFYNAFKNGQQHCGLLGIKSNLFLSCILISSYVPEVDSGYLSYKVRLNKTLQDTKNILATEKSKI